MHDYRVPSGRAGRLGPRPPRGLVGLASAALAIAGTGLVFVLRTERGPVLSSATGRPFTASRVVLYDGQSATHGVVLPAPLCVDGADTAIVTDLRWTTNSGIAIQDTAIRTRLLGDGSGTRVGASLADLGLDPGQHAIRTTCVTPASTTTPVAEIALDLTLSNVSLSSRASGLQVSYVAGQTTGRLSIPVTVQICSARFDVGQSCDTEARPATSLTD